MSWWRDLVLWLHASRGISEGGLCEPASAAQLQVVGILTSVWFVVQ